MRPQNVALVAGITIIDLVVAVLIVEALLRLVGYGYDDPKYSEVPIAFLKGDQSIFQLHGNAFTYVPHMRAESARVYYSKSDYKVEFDYKFHTNNFGLVQDEDVLPGRKSVLVLGDSFTEGVGSSPWFAMLAPVIEGVDYQPINGGLQGTGFHTWEELTQYLEGEGLQIEKLVIVFTSRDYNAPPMAFSEAYLRCLAEPVLKNCDLRKYFFLPLPPRELLSSWVDEVRKSRDAAPTSTFSSVKTKLKTLMPATYQVYSFMRTKFAPPPADTRKLDLENQSQVAIRALIERYGAKNLIFIHIPMKNEEKPSPDGLSIRQAISAAGAQLFDGFKLCGLSASDYYPIDVHPNETGYKKIASCVAAAFRTLDAN